MGAETSGRSARYVKFFLSRTIYVQNGHNWLNSKYQGYVSPFSDLIGKRMERVPAGSVHDQVHLVATILSPLIMGKISNWSQHSHICICI